MTEHRWARWMVATLCLACSPTPPKAVSSLPKTAAAPSPADGLKAIREGDMETAAASYLAMEATSKEHALTGRIAVALAMDDSDALATLLASSSPLELHFRLPGSGWMRPFPQSGG